METHAQPSLAGRMRPQHLRGPMTAVETAAPPQPMMMMMHAGPSPTADELRERIRSLHGAVAAMRSLHGVLVDRLAIVREATADPATAGTSSSGADASVADAIGSTLRLRAALQSQLAARRAGANSDSSDDDDEEDDPLADAPPPASAAAVAAIPRLSFRDLASDALCPICHSTAAGLGTSTPWIEQRCCGQRYCEPCAVQWLSLTRSCPTCRTLLTTPRDQVVIRPLMTTTGCSSSPPIAIGVDPRSATPLTSVRRPTAIAIPASIPNIRCDDAGTSTGRASAPSSSSTPTNVIRTFVRPQSATDIILRTAVFKLGLEDDDVSEGNTTPVSKDAKTAELPQRSAGCTRPPTVQRSQLAHRLNAVARPASAALHGGTRGDDSKPRSRLLDLMTTSLSLESAAQPRSASAETFGRAAAINSRPTSAASIAGVRGVVRPLSAAG
jgi:hypothetical protein